VGKVRTVSLIQYVEIDRKVDGQTIKPTSSETSSDKHTFIKLNVWFQTSVWMWNLVCKYMCIVTGLFVVTLRGSVCTQVRWSG